MTRLKTRPATTYRAIIGQVLARHRQSLGLTQAELAGSVGLTQSAWSRIERGDNALSVDQVREVSQIFRMPPSKLLDDAEQVARSLKRRGISVESRRPGSAFARGLVLIGAAALATVVVAILLKDD